MTTDPSPGRRVTRLENDVESVYEILADHTHRLTRVETTLTDHTRRLTRLETTQADHTRRLTRLETTQAEHTVRFDRIDGVLDEVLRRLPEPS